MTAAWTAGHQGGRQVNGQLSGEHSFKVALPQTLSLIHFLYIAEAVLPIGCQHFDCRRRWGGFMFFLLVSHVPAHSCWLVEHSKVAQLPLIGVQLGNFAQYQNLKSRGIAQRCSSSSVKSAKNCDCRTIVKLWQSQKSMAWNLTPLLCMPLLPASPVTHHPDICQYRHQN